MEPQTIAQIIIDTYKKHDYITIGEHITQLQHAEQCAKFAKDSGANDNIIIAALLHDIGQFPAKDFGIDTIKQDQLPGNLGTRDHEHIGAEILNALGFPQMVVDLVQDHVNAKRYLSVVNPSYNSKISDASSETLVTQGGIMSPHEIKSFEGKKYFKDVLKLRSWDDKAKIIDLIVPPIDTYKQIIINVLL